MHLDARPNSRDRKEYVAAVLVSKKSVGVIKCVGVSANNQSEREVLCTGC